MNNRDFKVSITILLILFSVFGFSQTENTRPNIILIFADDLGFTDVGFNRPANFPSEYGVIPTPEIDILAANGVIAKNAHVAHPFCGPSRAALLTGVYPHRVCAQYNLPNDIDDTRGVNVNEKFFSKVLQENNYNTSAFGKWHLGVDTQFTPNNRGFDYFFGMLGGGHQYFESDYEAQYYNALNNGNPVTNEYRVPLLRNSTYVAASEFANDEYLTDILTNEAVTYINNNATDTDPFFMYLAYNAPHTPLQAPADKIAAFDNANGNGTADSTFSTVVAASPDILNAVIPNSWTGTDQEYRDTLVEDRLIYATMVSIMDEGVGLVKDALIANNILDETLIIFMSDNGGKLRQAGAVNYPLTAGKGSVDEGGHRVPMLFHWPDKFTAGQSYDHLVTSLDLYPSFLDLAGAPVPAGKLLEGKSIMNNIITNQDARPTESIYIMRPQSGFHNGAIMNGDYKISKKGNNNTAAGFQLYNIVTDPGETTNIRSTEPNGEQIVNDMLTQGVAWVSEFQDVDPCWFDHDNPHPHEALWNDGSLPNYDGFFGMPLITVVDLISINGITDAIESQTDGVFTVSLPNGIQADQDINITYTVTGTATNGMDYPTLSGMVTISNGTNSTDIIITADDDGLNETSETVIIQLNTTSVGTVDSAPSQINILDVVVPTDATTLTTGDVAIVGWRAGSGNNGNGAIAFMLLKDITAATKLSISNRSWTASGWDGDYSIDDVWTWTAGSNFNEGDIFMLDADGLVKHVIGDAEVIVGTTVHDYTGKIAETSDGDFDISPNGEGILMYQVDPFALPTDENSSNWITGIITNGSWGAGGGNTFCILPAALTNGVNANAVGSDDDNGVYTGSLVGTASQLRASINDSANWVSNETTNYNLWRFDSTSGGTNGDIGMTGTLSVDNVTIENEIKLYPNPSQGNFTIKYSKTYNNIEVEILSISGKSIKKINAKSVDSQKIDISNFAAGLYIVKIKSDSITSFQKIMKL